MPDSVPVPDSSRGATRNLRDLVDPVVVVAFGGWNDAGDAATGAVEHLEEAYGAELVFSLDPDDFYDFQVNRPMVELNDNDEREIIWPTTALKLAELPDGRDLVLVQGQEPNLRWRQFSTLLASALSSANVTRVHLLGSLLADTPHTRPIPVSVTSGDRNLMTKLGLVPSTYEGPTGIIGVLADTLTRAGVEVLSLWSAIPHYVSHPPCPKATLALLSQLEEVLDTNLDLGELTELARAWERGVDELAAEDTEVAEYVASLEQQQDAAELPEASGEAIAAEFERYLRRRSSLADRLALVHSLCSLAPLPPRSKSRPWSTFRSPETDSGRKTRDWSTFRDSEWAHWLRMKSRDWSRFPASRTDSGPKSRHWSTFRDSEWEYGRSSGGGVASGRRAAATR